MGDAPMSAVDVLDEALSNWPDDEATVARSGRVTYRQLDALVEQHLHALIAAGVRPGDRLGVSLVNDLPLVALFHAGMRLGVIWVGVNRSLGTSREGVSPGRQPGRLLCRR